VPEWGPTLYRDKFN